MSSSRIVLGIDPGFGRMGFGCLRVERGRTTVLDYGVSTTKAGVAHEKRLLQISDDLDEIVRTHKPGVLAIEKLYFSKNVKTAMQVAEARGAILVVAARHGLPVVELSPGQVKMAVTGSGSADKKGVAMMVTKLLGLKRAPKLDDAADALALALCAANMR